MDKILIKKAVTNNAPVMADILTEATAYKQTRKDNAWGSGAYTVEEVMPRINAGTTYIVYIDNIAIGTFMLIWEDKLVWGEQEPVAGYIHQLAVKNGFHGKNIGAEMINWADSEVKRINRKFLRLDVPPQNQGLRRYYESLRFVHVRDQEVKTPHATYMASLYERPAH